MGGGKLNTDQASTDETKVSEPTDSEQIAASEPETPTTAGSETSETAPEAEAAKPALTKADLVKLAIELLQSEGYVVREATAAQRITAVKAEPAAVAAYFESTGLTRKQIADAVGVTVSVIATVQNPNGDRWSEVRFQAAKIMIDAYKSALEAMVKAAGVAVAAQA